MTFHELQQLRVILNESLDCLEDIYKKRSLDFPCLDHLHSADPATLLAENDQEAKGCIQTSIAAAYQILSVLRNPFATLEDAANAHHLSACLHVAEKFHVAEAVQESNHHGCHISVIADRCGVEATKLARILRVLTTHHIFRERKPDTFANNRVSSCLDTGKPFADIHQDPGMKYRDNGSEAAGYVGTIADDVGKASSYLLETLESPISGHSFSPRKAALQKAVMTEDTYFDWLLQPVNKYRFTRYAACIRATSLWDPPETVLKGFDWSLLGDDAIIVDVGGGTGVPAMIIARQFPRLRFIIQDQGPVIAQAVEYWNRMYPMALQSGQVSFQVHDFFRMQPQKDASLFLLRTISHDWPDEQVVEILTRLREAVTSDTTRLLLGDFVMPYAIPGTNGVQMPLLGNLGKASANAFFVDMTMQVLLNGQERTLSHHEKLLTKSGWQTIHVDYIRNSLFAYILAEAA